MLSTRAKRNVVPAYRYQFSQNAWANALKPGLPLLSQMLDKTCDKRSLTTVKWVFGQENDLYCMELANSVGRPGYFCPYERGEILLSHSKVDGPLQRSDDHLYELLWGVWDVVPFLLSTPDSANNMTLHGSNNTGPIWPMTLEPW